MNIYQKHEATYEYLLKNMKQIMNIYYKYEANYEYLLNMYLLEI